MIFAHCSKLEKRKKLKTLIIFFEAIICQTDGLSSNSRVTEKIEELVNLVSFERDQLKFGKLKRRLACLHTALGSALKSSPFFSFFSYTAALLCIPTIWLEALKTSRRGFLFISSCNYCAERLCCCCTPIQMRKKSFTKARAEEKKAWGQWISQDISAS